MSPPGIAMVAVSPRAWEFQASANLPRFYFDLERLNCAARDGQYPWTPALSTLYGMQAALRSFQSVGMDSVYARHREIADRVRVRIRRAGLELFSRQNVASDTVTAVKLPSEVDASLFREIAHREYGIVFGAGLAHLQKSMFRIGHLGWLDDKEIDHALDVVEIVLNELRPGQLG